MNTGQMEQMQDKWWYMYQKQRMLLYKYEVKYILTFWYNNKWMQKALGTPNTYAYTRDIKILISLAVY